MCKHFLVSRVKVGERVFSEDIRNLDRLLTKRLAASAVGSTVLAGEISWLD